MELDVRSLRKPDKHPTVFAAYAELAVGASFVLINDHDPRHLHDEFEADHAGGYGWEYRSREPRDWRIEITKLTSTPLPQILADSTELGAGTGGVDATGADGLRYLTVRRRRQALLLDTSRVDAGPAS